MAEIYKESIRCNVVVEIYTKKSLGSQDNMCINVGSNVCIFPFSSFLLFFANFFFLPFFLPVFEVFIACLFCLHISCFLSLASFSIIFLLSFSSLLNLPPPLTSFTLLLPSHFFPLLPFSSPLLIPISFLISPFLLFAIRLPPSVHLIYLPV